MDGKVDEKANPWAMFNNCFQSPWKTATDCYQAGLSVNKTGHLLTVHASLNIGLRRNSDHHQTPRNEIRWSTMNEERCSKLIRNYI